MCLLLTIRLSTYRTVILAIRWRLSGSVLLKTLSVCTDVVTWLTWIKCATCIYTLFCFQCVHSGTSQRIQT